MKKIAVLLTCHNRKDKTVRCLTGLLRLKDAYNTLHQENEIDLWTYLTDDGCTDGTVEAIKGGIGNKMNLQILSGSGNLFWAGGMRFCWNEALKHHEEWDYYLLLNDDVELLDTMFDELFQAEEFSKNQYRKEGIVSGFICNPNDMTKTTYGGGVWLNKMLAKQKRLTPSGHPQLCDMTNANILLVPAMVVDKIGIFYKGYQHGLADYDYSNTARKKGIPVILTANFCGKCEDDHLTYGELAKKVTTMTFRERKSYFRNPIHSSRDYLRYIARVAPLRWPMVWLGRILNLYFPGFYYRMSGVRMN